MSTAPDMSRRNKRVAGIAAGVAAAMLGLAFASVPLYRLFCEATGFNGTTQRASAAPQAADATVSVRFDANVEKDMGWTFHPAQGTLKVRLGEPVLAKYVAVNTTAAEITGTAIFNVTPPEAGAYFNKIECFCFTEQTLKAGTRAEMPVQFFVDPAMLKDADARNIREITLSYTFYPTKKTANDQAALSTN